MPFGRGGAGRGVLPWHAPLVLGSDAPRGGTWGVDAPRDWRSLKYFTQISIADIYISISMETFGHREYKSRGEDGNK